MLDSKVKVFHESISCFIEMTLNMYFMKCSERKFHSVSFPLESLFNSEYCKIFKCTYSEEHLQAAASENVFMKVRKKNYI